MSQPQQTIDAREYTVHGMTCGHCAMSVREELFDLPGVSAVDIDLASGRLTVTGERLDDDAISAAVEQAGYEVA